MENRLVERSVEAVPDARPRPEGSGQFNLLLGLLNPGLPGGLVIVNPFRHHFIQITTLLL